MDNQKIAIAQKFIELQIKYNALKNENIELKKQLKNALNLIFEIRGA
jgi:hypothetical protein